MRWNSCHWLCWSATIFNRIPAEHRRALATSHFSLDGPVPPGSVADLVRPNASAIARSARVPVCAQILAASVSLVSIDHVESVGGVQHGCRSRNPRLATLHGRRHRKRVPKHTEPVFPRFPYVPHVSCDPRPLAPFKQCHAAWLISGADVQPGRLVLTRSGHRLVAGNKGKEENHETGVDRPEFPMSP